MSVDIEKICRTCLALSGPLLSIFDGNSGSGSSCVADMLKDLTKIKPKPGDKMPEKVCLSCISEINRSYSFKMKCENSNKTLHQLIPEAIVDEDSTPEIQKKKVQLSTKGIQTTPDKRKKFATVQSQTIMTENSFYCHQQVQTDIQNCDKSTSPISEKLSKQEKRVQPKMEEFQVAESEQLIDEYENSSKRRMTRSALRLANQKQLEKNEKVIAFKRLTLDPEDQNADEVIYELQSEHEPDLASADEADDDDTNIKIDNEETTEIEQTAYYVLSDSQGGEDLVNYDVAYDSDNFDEAIDSENVNQHEEQIPKDDYNFTIINSGEDGEEEIAATTSLAIVRNDGLNEYQHLSVIKKFDFNCPECPMAFVSVNNLKRHCLKAHNWSVDEINVLDEVRISSTETKSNTRKPPLKRKEIQEVEKNTEPTTVKALQIERYNQKHLKKENSSLTNVTTLNNEDHSNVVASPAAMNFFCPHCNAGFVLRKSLDFHIKQNLCAIKSFTCPDCKRVFSSEETLEEHQKTHVLEFNCAECNTVYHTNSELSQHLIDVHNRNPKNQCGVCKKVFTMLSALKDHLRIHSGEKPFICPTCGKGFRQNTNLKQHLMRHSSIKPFQCSECALSFVSKAELISHSRVHVGGHPYKCEMCDARYTTSSSLVKHVRKHTGERPYACEYCPRRFSVLNVLKNHRRIHTGEKPFECVYCKKSFAQKSDCQTHQRTHTGEKPYICHCNAAFTHLSTLRTHLKLHEKEQNEDVVTKRKRKSINSDDASPNQRKMVRSRDRISQDSSQNHDSQQENANMPVAHETTSEDLIQLAINDVY